MKFEIVCRDCQFINRGEVPLPSKRDPLIMYCARCELDLLTFYHDEHFLGIAIKKIIEKENKSKVIKT